MCVRQALFLLLHTVQPVRYNLPQQQRRGTFIGNKEAADYTMNSTSRTGHGALEFFDATNAHRSGPWKTRIGLGLGHPSLGAENIPVKAPCYLISVISAAEANPHSCSSCVVNESMNEFASGALMHRGSESPAWYITKDLRQ